MQEEREGQITLGPMRGFLASGASLLARVPIRLVRPFLQRGGVATERQGLLSQSAERRDEDIAPCLRIYDADNRSLHPKAASRRQFAHDPVAVARCVIGGPNHHQVAG